VDEKRRLFIRGGWGAPSGAERIGGISPHAEKPIAAVAAGSFGVNQPCGVDPAAPFSGVKASGIGRERDREGIVDTYLDLKSISRVLAS